MLQALHAAFLSVTKVGVGSVPSVPAFFLIRLPPVEHVGTHIETFAWELRNKGVQDVKWGVDFFFQILGVPLQLPSLPSLPQPTTPVHTHTAVP